MFDDDPRWETTASATTTLAISTDAIENLFTCGRNTLATRSHNAVLIGQSEPDVPGRGSRGLHVVAEAERERSPQPVLREHARGIAWRRRVLVLRYAHQGRRGRDWRRANRPQARLRRRRFELIREGWFVSVDYCVLNNQIRPKDHAAILRPFLPAKYSPLQESGDGLQSVYLAEVSSAKRTGMRIRPSPFFRAPLTRPTSRPRSWKAPASDRRSRSRF